MTYGETAVKTSPVVDRYKKSIAKLEDFMQEWDREIAEIKMNMDKRIAASMPDSNREITK